MSKKSLIIILAFLILVACIWPAKSNALSGIGSCGYWDKGASSFVEGAEVVGYGVFLIPDFENPTAQLSLWVDKEFNWAVLIGRMRIDPQYGKQLWACVIAEGKGWKSTPHLQSNFH